MMEALTKSAPTKKKAFQAKHIDTTAVLRVINLLITAQKHPYATASRWDIVDAFKPIPWKIVNAKLVSLKKRKLIDGCAACTCRGSFTLTSRGKLWLLERKETL